MVKGHASRFEKCNSNAILTGLMECTFERAQVKPRFTGWFHADSEFNHNLEIGLQTESSPLWEKACLKISALGHQSSRDTFEGQNGQRTHQEVTELFIHRRLW
jgi:hypothetical protein